MSGQNKVNHAANNIIHTTGSKSAQQMAEEEVQNYI